MEWIDVYGKLKGFLSKYRYVALVLCVGLILMLIPEKNPTKADESQAQILTETQSQESLQDSLSDILSKIEGAGKVQVLLSTAAGERTVYQTDEDISNGDSSESIRRETVVITGDNRQETGLIQQINPPLYLGAIVLCQGADNAAVRLAIVEAVSNATGLSTDKISVLKMK